MTTLASTDAALTIHIDDYRAIPVRTRQLIQMYAANGPAFYPDNRGILTIIVAKDRAVEIAKELGIAPKAIESIP